MTPLRWERQPIHGGVGFWLWWGNWTLCLIKLNKHGLAPDAKRFICTRSLPHLPAMIRVGRVSAVLFWKVPVPFSTEGWGRPVTT